MGGRPAAPGTRQRETSEGARQVFAAVARTDTPIETLIRRSLAEAGQTKDGPVKLVRLFP
jgi:hypothetical protein